MSDHAVVALAVATAIGARAARPVPLALALAAAAVAVAVAMSGRRPWLLLLSAALLASGLSSRAWRGLADPVTGRLDGWATLVSDPEPTDRGVVVDLRLDDDRYRAVAFGSTAGQLRLRAAGQAVDVSGVARRADLDEMAWLVPRHVGAELEVESVGEWSAGGPPTRLANLLRRTLDRGASVMSQDHRALFSGFVLGDDREQSPQIVEEFRASGLSHLLVVSGQNVALVLAVVSPALRRLTLSSRFVATVCVIAFFALMTRFEPSVLRASGMAGLAAFATTLGREASGLRLLGLAVAGLILVDPLLVHSLGFRLSVGASAGILLIGPAVSSALPGPRWLGSATGVTIGAQVGVAPLLVPAFGGLPLVALPANLLAAPAAGPLVAWGMSAGLVAGWLRPVIGDATTRVLHLPTDALVEWIAGVARLASRAPLGELRLGHLMVVTPVLAVLVLRRTHSSRPPWRWACDAARAVPSACVVLVALGGMAAVVFQTAVPPAPAHARPADGVEVWLDGHTHDAIVVLDGHARAGAMLEGLRRAGVRRLALLVVASSSGRRSFRETVEAVSAMYPPGIVLLPNGAEHNISGAATVRSATVYRIGDLWVRVDRATAGHLAVDVTRRRRAIRDDSRRHISPRAPVATPFGIDRTTDDEVAAAGAIPGVCLARGPPTDLATANGRVVSRLHRAGTG